MTPPTKLTAVDKIKQRVISVQPSIGNISNSSAATVDKRRAQTVDSNLS